MSDERKTSFEREPIDAEFEPAPGAPNPDGRGGRLPPRRPRAPVTHGELALGAVASAISGAVMAIIWNSAGPNGDGAGAAKLARLSQESASIDERSRATADQVARLSERLDTETQRFARELADQRAISEGFRAVAEDSLGGFGGPGASSLTARLEALESAVETSGSSTQLRLIQRNLADLKGRLDDLEAADARLDAALKDRTSALVALEAELQRTTGELAGLRKEVAATGSLSNDVSEVRKTLSAIEREREPIRSAVSGAMGLRALAAAESAALRGRPFVAPYESLMQSLPGDPDLAALGPISRTGAPTLAELSREFDAVAQRALQARARATDDGWNWLRTSVSGVMTIHPTPDPEARATLQAARLGLAEGDLAEAVEAVSALNGGYSPAFATWRERAQRRIRLDEGLDAVGARLAAATASEEGPRTQE